MRGTTAQSETGALVRVLVKHARDAFRSQDAIAAEWRPLHYTAAPELARAIAEHERFADLLRGAGAEVIFLPPEEGLGLDSLYARDASIVCDRGVILCSMGKRARAAEPAAQAATYARLGVPVLGAIEPPGTLEGGDVVWLERGTLLVGQSDRTNREGIRQLRGLLDEVEIVVAPLPSWRGPHDVFHLMSVLSPIDRDLALVYSPLLPASLRSTLLERGIELIEVPDAEFESLGTNVLALAPRRSVLLRGNQRTRARLERVGAEVLEYDGLEISLKGGGGPTCLTRPLARRQDRVHI